MGRKNVQKNREKVSEELSQVTIVLWSTIAIIVVNVGT